MEKLLTLLYGISGVTAVALYLPQIQAYRRNRAACLSISLLSWSGWLAVACVTVLYALCVIHNPLVAGIALLNVLAQVTVLYYGMRARLDTPHPARQQAVPTDTQQCAASPTTTQPMA